MEKSFSGKILLVEDNPDDRDLFGAYLAEVPSAKFNLTSCASLAEARKMLATGSFDVMVLDLGLPDSQGLATFERLQSLVPQTPTLILSGLKDEGLGMEAVRQGAQDYLLKDQLTGAWLVRAIRYAIERKKLERKVQESEARFRDTFEQAAVGIAHVAVDGRWLRVNQKLCDIVGYSREELLERTFQDITHPDDLEADLESVQQLLDGVIPTYTMEKRYIRKDASIVWINLTVSLVRDEADTPLYFISVIEDIGRRKELEDALRVSKESFDNIVRATTNGLMVLDPQSAVKYVNPTTEVVLGRSADELMGHRFEYEMTPGTATEIDFPNQPGGTKTVEIVTSETEWEAQPALLLSLTDITQRRRAQNELRQSEARYKTIVEAETGYIYTVQVEDGRAVRTVHGAACEAVTGYRQEAFAADPDLWYSMVYEEDREIVAENAARVLTGQQCPPLVHRIVHKDGSLRWVASRAVLRFNEQGRLVAYEAILSDITARKNAEQALHRSNDLLYAITRAQSQFISATELANLFGELLSNLLSVTESEYGFMGEILYPETGTPHLVTHAITDISWNEETRQFYEEHSREGLHFCNLKSLYGTVITTGKPVISNSPASDPRRCGLPVDHPPLNAFLGLPVYSGENIIGMIGIANRRGGYDETLVADLQPLITTCGSIMEAFKNDQRRKAAEKKLKDYSDNLEIKVEERTSKLTVLNTALSSAQKKAEAATQAKSNFLANMSHEIRTPMNAILGMTYLAMQAEPSPKLQDYLSKISFAANSLLGVINDILDFSKIEAGKLEIEKVGFNLEQVLTNLANMTSWQAHEKGLEFLVSLDPQVPFRLVGDPLRLGQVLTNLAGNAVKFTERGEIMIRITREKEEDGQVFLYFGIQDTGIGISKERQAELFQPFSQADASITRKYGGTGLGLVICRRLVNLMGGEIKVESEPDHGSTFFFTLPFEPQLKVENNGLLAPTLRGMRILVVDDNISAQRVTMEMLKSYSFTAESVSSGPEALEMLAMAEQQGRPYPLVLMDWHMPEMDGIETARRIRAERTSTPRIIMLTAYGREELEALARDVDLDGFLTKPVSRSALLEAILNAFGQGIEATAAEPPTPRDRARTAPLAGARVLVVEDNDINRQVAQELLQSWQLVVTLAENGKVALDRVQEQPFDLVLMDIQMPVMDGLTATRKIRALPSEISRIPIIAMTAHAMSGDREKSLAAGMNDHVTKPLDPDSLLRALVKHLKVESQAVPLPWPTNCGDVQLPTLTSIDMQAGLNRVLGNSSLYLKLLRSFQQQNRDFVSLFQQRLAAQDPQAARFLAHTLNGAAGAIGAVSVQVAAGKVEAACAQGKEIPPLLVELEQALGKVLKELADRLPQQKEPEMTGAGGTAAAVDPALLQPGLAKLAALLEAHDMNSVAVFAELRGMLFNALPTEAAELASLMERLDFKSAQASLDTISSILDISLIRGKEA